MATKSTISTTMTIQLAPAPSHLTVRSSIESGLYGHVSECATEASESRPTPAVSHSLLDMLKAPTAAEINCEWKVKDNPPGSPVGKHKFKGSSFSNPKGIHPSKRVMECPNEEPQVSSCKLFCSACQDNR